MTEELVKSWNEVVDVNDDVYHLGDVSLCNANKTESILSRLNGKIHLIKGNHEKSVLQTPINRGRFIWVKDYHEMSVFMSDGTKQFIVLCHYGMRVWNKSHHGSWMLYGHSHDSMEHEAWGRSMDVGVDSAYRILGEYRPFNLNEIAAIMSKRQHNPVDHHLELRTQKHNVNLKRNL
jgi:calcineurin-like phosphoesterase family protein